MAHSGDELSHHQGLAHDLRVLTRRRWLGMLAGAAAGAPLIAAIPALAGCDGDSGGTVDAGTGDAGGGDAAAGDGGSCARIPEETAGPYPGDGTNGANALVLSGIVRSDIRASIAGATGVAEGIALVVTLNVVDSATCEPLAGRAVYIWHCDREGDYSMYTGGASGENYLRGVQETDAAGQVEFTTIVPACYAGRWPHIHFEIYPSLAAATTGASKIAVSQLALPKAMCDAVFATDGYRQSVSNLAQVSLASDMVFRDGVTLQLPSVTGSIADGFAAALTVAAAG
jgi:protocatechuate 3,4-dioxygenase beta subunit